MIRLLEQPAADLIRDLEERFARHERIRVPLPHGGRLYIDRALPFLAVYRTPPDRPDPGTKDLVTGQAAYLLAAGDPASGRDVAALVDAIAATLARAFGGFLMLELWSSVLDKSKVDPTKLPEPRFRLLTPAPGELEQTTTALVEALGELKLFEVHPEVTVDKGVAIAPPGLTPLMRPARARRLGVRLLGLEVGPVHQDPDSGDVYPLVLRALRRRLTTSLSTGFAAFMQEHTAEGAPVHPLALGRRSPGQVVWEVDRQLAELAEAFDFTLQVTPINVQAAWNEFKKNRYERAPEFLYRPLPIDPVLHKRRLFDTPLERIEDPTLQHLFGEKVVELDRMLTMLQDRGSPKFLWGGLSLYGPVDDDLLSLARRILRVVPAQPEPVDEPRLSPWQFAERARAEIDEYKKQWPELQADVHVREDVAGLMHSRGDVLVSASATIEESRADALIAHEVGTHLVCYHNGRAQPFQQLYAGLRGYRELQEGLAVLSEYLVGGLDRPRMRTIAARVVAARALTDGASFVDTFRELRAHHGLTDVSAYRVAMRAWRGGGLVRDAVYLRALVGLLDYLGAGHEIEPLFIGRIALGHVPFVRELVWREVLRTPPLSPRYLQRPDAQERLAELRRLRATPLDLVFDRKLRTAEVGAP